MTQAKGFNKQDLVTTLERMGMPSLQANTIAHGLGLHEARMPEGVQAFRHAIDKLADAYTTTEARLVQVEALIQKVTLLHRKLAELVLPAHEYQAVDQAPQHHVHRN